MSVWKEGKTEIELRSNEVGILTKLPFLNSAGIGFRLPLDPLPPLFSLSWGSSVPVTRAMGPFLRPDESDPPLGVSTEADETVALRRKVDVVLLGECVVRLYESLRRVEPEIGGVVST